jgi:hypothetical protein
LKLTHGENDVFCVHDENASDEDEHAHIKDVNLIDDGDEMAFYNIILR